jgi:hypothetical protein
MASMVALITAVVAAVVFVIILDFGRVEYEDLD